MSILLKPKDEPNTEQVSGIFGNPPPGKVHRAHGGRGPMVENLLFGLFFFSFLTSTAANGNGRRTFQK